MIPVLQPKQVKCINGQGNFLTGTIYDVDEYGYILWLDRSPSQRYWNAEGIVMSKFEPVYTDAELLEYAAKMYPIGTKYIGADPSGGYSLKFTSLGEANICRIGVDVGKDCGYVYVRNTNTWAEILAPGVDYEMPPRPRSYAVECPKDYATSKVWQNYINYLNCTYSAGFSGDSERSYYGVDKNGVCDFYYESTRFDMIYPISKVDELTGGAKITKPLEEQYAYELSEVEKLFPEGMQGGSKEWDGQGTIKCLRKGGLYFDQLESHTRIFSHEGSGILWSTKHGFSKPDLTKGQPQIGDWIKIIDKPTDGSNPPNWCSSMDLFYGVWLQVKELLSGKRPYIKDGLTGWTIEHSNYTEVKTNEEYMAYVYDPALTLSKPTKKTSEFENSINVKVGDWVYIKDFSDFPSGRPRHWNSCGDMDYLYNTWQQIVEINQEDWIIIKDDHTQGTWYIIREDISMRMTDEEYKKISHPDNVKSSHTFKAFEDEHISMYERLVSERQKLVDEAIFTKPDWISRLLGPSECFKSVEPWKPTGTFTTTAANLVATKPVKVTGYKYVNLKNK